MDPAFDTPLASLRRLLGDHAAVRHNMRREKNTGPDFTFAGPTYEGIDFSIPPDVPLQPGTGLYPLCKSLGRELEANND